MVRNSRNAKKESKRNRMITAVSPMRRVIAKPKAMIHHAQMRWFKFFNVELVLPRDRKSTRLNSSHVAISYAVFCLKKKIKQTCKIRTVTHKILGGSHSTRQP